MKLVFKVSLFFVLYFFTLVHCDTPANCTYEDIRGLWIFKEGPRGNDKTINCSKEIDYITTYTIQLNFPDIASDDNGNIGFWTIICNQGFEVVIQKRKFFAFSYYEQNGKDIESSCDRTFPGWSHEAVVDPHDWACFSAMKYDVSKTNVKTYTRPESDLLRSYHKQTYYKSNFEFVDKINSVTTSWKARNYEFMTKMTIDGLIKITGGKNSRVIFKPKPSPITPDIEELAAMLPASFDWRNIDGVNYVSPIRDQGECGSCYAFSSMSMNECRLRIKSNNTLQLIFSPQDIVDCSEYSQGCNGGFPYLISGKYAEDFGLVEEACLPYSGKNGTCYTKNSCKRYYSTNYRYVGGFYGACNEALMRIELVKNGPFVVSFEVYDDFINYESGIYHHTGLVDDINFKFNPFELINHAVLLVGYGSSPTDGDYWIVKNSWGTTWGESGYFRIRRGTDECSIESSGVASDIIF